MFKLIDNICSPDAVQTYEDSVKTDKPPVVIDNGSYQCRVGWASSTHPDLAFKNVLARNRANRKERDWDIQVGNEIADIEAIRWMVRTPFEFNVVVNYSVQETLFDYTFKHLGIDTEDHVAHPILMTEAIANPPYCRKNMSELLFEAYCVPRVSYGIDCLFSYYNSNVENSKDTALVVSSGFQSTHVLPFIEGLPDVRNCCRVNLGGYNCSAYLQRLLQFKHPQYTSEFTLSRMETIVQNLGMVAENYDDLSEQWSNVKYKDDNSTTVHFDPRSTAGNAKEVGSLHSSVLALEKKLKQAEYRLYEMECVLELEGDNPDVAFKACVDAGCDNLDELKLVAKKIQDEIEEIRAKLCEHYPVGSNNKASRHCVPVGVETIQVPEIIFQPSLVGYDQCGLSGAIEAVLSRYSPNVQNALAANVFLTGGNTRIKGFFDRVLYDLRQMRPFQSKVSVTQAKDPSTDSWKGAAKWALSDSHSSWISRNDFEEFGWDYIKEHKYSNRWLKLNK